MDYGIRQKLDEFYKEYDMPDKPGVIIGVIEDGKTEYVKAYGMANLEHHLPLTPDSVLQVASVSKQFTAFAVLLLSEENKIDLDAPVKTYLDYFPDFDHEITVRHMVHHVSGLRCPSAFLRINGIDLRDVYTKELILTIAKKQRRLNFEPGTMYTYSNLGYALLAEIVSKVTEKPFRAYMDERIFKPLGMEHSFFHDTKFELIKNKAEAYTVSSTVILNCPINHSNFGSTNLFTTVKDMIKWAKELMDPQFFSKSTIKKAFIPYECQNAHKTGYGFGLRQQDFKGQAVFGHGGSDAGYRAQILMIPQGKTAVILLSNRSDFEGVQYVRKTMDIVTNINGTTPVPQKISRSVDISGVYYIEKMKYALIIEKTSDGTYLKQIGPDKEIFRKDKHRFIIPDLNKEFELDKKGGVRLFLNDNVFSGNRIHVDTIPESDRTFAGKYISKELDAVYDVMFMDDNLVLSNNKTGDLSFKKYNNGIYLDTLNGSVSVEFRNKKMFVSAERAVNVEFEMVDKSNEPDDNKSKSPISNPIYK